MQARPIIECSDLSKAYTKRTIALSNLNLTIDAGMSFGLLANCIVIAALVIAFSPPIATRIARIGLLAWLAAVLYSNTSPGPIAQALSFTRIPLIPLQICYNMGATGTIGLSGIVALLFMVGYTAGLTALAQFWMHKRDVILA